MWQGLVIYVTQLWQISFCNHFYSAILFFHYHDDIMSAMASQVTSLTIVYSNLYSGEDQRKYQGSASLAFVRGIHRGRVMRKMFPFDEVSMSCLYCCSLFCFILYSMKYVLISYRDNAKIGGMRHSVHLCKYFINLNATIGFLNQIDWIMH